MTKLEAWYRRRFCDTIYVYERLDGVGLGTVWYAIQNRTVQYIYVGKNKLWIKRVKKTA